VTDTDQSTDKRITVRAIAALVAFVLGLALLPIGMVAYWGHRTVTDETRYLETVQPLAYDADVQDAIAEFIIDKVEQQIDPEALVEQIFAGLLEKQPALKALVPIVSGAIDSLIEQVVYKIVRSEQFAELWTLANTAAQKSIMAILQGNPDGPISLQGDEVVLDISSLLDQVKQGLVDRGFGAAANINVPESDRTIVLLEAPQLAQIRTIYSFTSPIASGLIWVSILLFVVAIVLARRRPRMAAWSGGAIVVVGAGLVIALGIAEGVFVNTLAGTPFEQASQTFWDTLLKFLINAASVTILLGIVVLVVGLVLSRARWARELRSAFVNLAERVSTTIPAGPITSSGAWVAENIRWVRVAIGVLFALIVLIGSDLSVARTLWACVICLVLLGAVEVWAAAGRRTQIEVVEVDVEIEG
jgi:hypothetical protein